MEVKKQMLMFLYQKCKIYYQHYKFFRIYLKKEYVLDVIQTIKYRLIGIVCHIGTFDFGHYFSVVDEIGILNVNSQLEKWILFDDLNVEYISLERLNKIQTWAYLLFYKRVF